MYDYRITKYDPAKRNERGHYMHDEWTSISDVGRTYNHVLFTMQEYEVTEAAYVQAVLTCMKALGIDTLTCSYLEHDFDIDTTDWSTEWLRIYNTIKVGESYTKSQLEIVIRMVLREYVWCKLEHGQKMFVHFGYDYYMYIGVARECGDIVQKIEASGLFVEDFVSPYLADNANL